MRDYNLRIHLVAACLLCAVVGLLVGFPHYAAAVHTKPHTRTADRIAAADRPPVQDPPDLGDPQPRPPLDSEAPPPRNRRTGKSDGEGRGSAQPGRITGTVIDQRTGYPTARVAVSVGGVIFYTDINGNYDAPGLPAGRYLVTLVMSVAQGTPSYPPLQLRLFSGETVVQHLPFVSPSPTLDASETGPEPTPTVQPAPTPQSSRPL